MLGTKQKWLRCILIFPNWTTIHMKAGRKKVKVAIDDKIQVISGLQVILLQQHDLQQPLICLGMRVPDTGKALNPHKSQTGNRQGMSAWLCPCGTNHPQNDSRHRK